MPDELHLDAKTHIYTVGDTVYPGVTDILKAAGLIDDEWFTEESRFRGECVHIATALYDTLKLDFDGMDESIRPYVEAYIKFRQESECKILEIEKKFVNKRYGFAGKFDRKIMLHGRTGLLDIKAGAKQAWHGVQLQGYRIGIHGIGHKAFCLYLSSKGTYKLVETEEDPEAQAFLAALNLYKYKKENGLI